MAKASLGALALVLATGVALSALHNRSDCAQCDIELLPIAVLGSGRDSILLRRETRLARTERGFAAAPTYTPGAVVEFDSTGRIDGTFGRSGQGPAEMSQIVYLRSRGTDRLVLFGVGKVIEVDAARRVIHEVRLPLFANDMVPIGTDDYLLAGLVMVPHDSLQLLHVVQPSGKIKESVLTVGGLSTAPSDTWSVVRFLSRTPDGGALAVSGNRYRLEVRGPTGALDRELVLNREWFAPWSGYVERENFAAPPRPRLASAVQKSADEICVLAYVADEDWEPTRTQGEINLEDVDYNAIFDSVLEVIDSESGQLRASRRFDQTLRFVDGTCTVYSMRETAYGVWQAHVFKPVVR